MKDTLQHDALGEVDPTRPPTPAGMIIRKKEPANLEMPFDELDSFLTPDRAFLHPQPFSTPAAGVRHLPAAH